MTGHDGERVTRDEALARLVRAAPPAGFIFCEDHDVPCWHHSNFHSTYPQAESTQESSHHNGRIERYGRVGNGYIARCSSCCWKGEVRERTPEGYVQAMSDLSGHNGGSARP